MNFDKLVPVWMHTCEYLIRAQCRWGSYVQTSSAHSSNSYRTELCPVVWLSFKRSTAALETSTLKIAFRNCAFCRLFLARFQMDSSVASRRIFGLSSVATWWAYRWTWPMSHRCMTWCSQGSIVVASQQDSQSPKPTIYETVAHSEWHHVLNRITEI